MSGECVAALDRRIDRWGGAYGEAALMGPVMTRIFCIRVMNLHAGQYKEPLLACAGDSSKQVQEELLALYAAHKEWESEFVTMLRAGKQKERLMAARVLEQWGADARNWNKLWREKRIRSCRRISASSYVCGKKTEG